MDLFEKNHGTIKTRGIILAQDQMDNFMKRRINNYIGDPDFLNCYDAEEMLQNHIFRGDFCLLEMAEEWKIYILSVINFEDIWSRNVYSFKNFDY
jgi:hypothetical protein